MTGIYVVEGYDERVGHVVRRVVVADSASVARESISPDAAVGRLGDYTPGIEAQRLVPGQVVATVIYR